MSKYLFLASNKEFQVVDGKQYTKMDKSDFGMNDSSNIKSWFLNGNSTFSLWRGKAKE